MKQIEIVCAAGIGDALIFHIASYHLSLAGLSVTTVTPHRFGKWFDGYRFSDVPIADTIFLQHDNSLKAKQIHASNRSVYTFYGSHLESKHGPLRSGFDYVCNPKLCMVENLVLAIQTLFHLPATPENGFHPPPHLIHRRYPRRIAIHTGSSDKDKNWPLEKFMQVADFLKNQGYEPTFLPLFPTLEELASFIYESGFFLGNDSGPGHIASCLNIPHLIIGRDQKQMELWRPGWLKGTILTPSPWIPNCKPLRIRKNWWKSLIPTKKVIKILNDQVLNN